MKIEILIYYQLPPAAEALIPMKISPLYATLSFLQSLGMKFDYGFNCAYDDCEQDFTRLEKLFDVLQQLKTHNDFAQARESALHNQQLIVSGKFKANCVSHNESQIKLIKAWHEN